MAEYTLIAAGGGVRNAQYSIDTTATNAVPGSADYYIGVFANNQNSLGGAVTVTARVASTAVVTFYQTASPLANVKAGTAIWSVITGLSGLTSQAAGIGTSAVISGPVTAISYSVGTALAGLQATIAIQAGYEPGRPATF